MTPWRIAGDSADVGGDAESMLFICLFEDEDGKTIAASHSARPFANGQKPSDSDTYIFREEDGRWIDITTAALPRGVLRSWWFRFNEFGDYSSCGPYVRFSRQDGRGKAYRFGEALGSLHWDQGRYQFKPKG